VGHSRKPLSALSRQHAEQLKGLLISLGELETQGATLETGISMSD
jgi:hypothetical protein